MSRAGKKPAPPAVGRWSIASRVLAAHCGGYAVAALLSAVLALALPRLSEATRADGVLIASLLSFVIYTVAALWVFCARTAWRAWYGLGLTAAAAAGLLLLLRGAT